MERSPADTFHVLMLVAHSPRHNSDEPVSFQVYVAVFIDHGGVEGSGEYTNVIVEIVTVVRRKKDESSLNFFRPWLRISQMAGSKLSRYRPE